MAEDLVGMRSILMEELDTGIPRAPAAAAAGSGQTSYAEALRKSKANKA